MKRQHSLAPESARTPVDTTGKTPRQSDAAYLRLKTDIITCQLAPGRQFSELELSTHYGMGRAALRSALTRLCEIGLLESIPRRGFQVTPITVKSVTDLFDLRLIIEPSVAEAAAGKVDAARLRELNEHPQDATSETEQIAFLRSNHDFHCAIAAATGNRRLTDLMSNLLDEATRLVHLGLFGATEPDEEVEKAQRAQDEQHEALILAFEARDTRAAVEAARNHVQHSKDLALERILSGALPVHI